MVQHKLVNGLWRDPNSVELQHGLVLKVTDEAPGNAGIALNEIRRPGP